MTDSNKGESRVGWARKPNGRQVWRAARLTPEKLAALGLARPVAAAPVAPPAGPSEHVVTGVVEAALTKAMTEASRTGEPYLSISDVCRKFAISRSSFYEMLPRLEAEGLIARVPPGGPVRVPIVRFASWLHAATKPAALVTRRSRKAGR